LEEDWILDAYAGSTGEMVVWIKRADGGVVRLTDLWYNAIYVSADKKSDLEELSKKKEIQSFVYSACFVWKREHVFDYHETEVLKLVLRRANEAERLAKVIEKSAEFGRYRIYNADLLPAQAYLIEKGLFPLAKVNAEKIGDIIHWKVLDSVESEDYEVPALRRALLRIEANARFVPKFTDRIRRITILTNEKTIEITTGSEKEKILSLVEEIKKLDPDLLFIEGGDAFTTHYLVERAYANEILDKLVLSRDQVPLRRLEKRGTSYFAYGRILYTPSSHQLYGRINLDADNQFIIEGCGLEGLFEIARICRIPLHKGSRASIGKCLSSMQFNIAYKDNLLIPWKPTRVEVPKTGRMLLTGDRGGFIFEPKVGVHEGVGEIDFVSLYPFIMKEYNISAETVLCRCCRGSKLRVPDVNYNICEKRRGLISRSLELVLSKRIAYKHLKKELEVKNPDLAKIYQARIDALKGILVCCLTRDSPVLIQRDGVTRYVKIGDFIDSIAGRKEGIIDCPSGIFVSGLDQDLRARFCKIRKLIRVPSHCKTIHTLMDDGRRIVTTADHPFFILGDGELRTKPAEALKKGDLVPVAKQIPFNSNGADSINLIEWAQKNLDKHEQYRWKVSGPILKDAIATKKKLVRDLSIEAGYNSNASNHWQKTGMIPLAFFPSLKIPIERHTDLRVGLGRKNRKAGGRTSWLPATIPINEELGFFLGLEVSDGSAQDTYIRFDIGTSQLDLLQNARQVIESLFRVTPRVYKEKKAEMYVLQTNSLALVNFLERVVGLPGSVERGKLKIPALIFNSNRSTAEGFVQGLLAGDGTANKSRNFVSIGTASWEFANQLGFLAATLGLGFRIDKHSREPMNPLYCINFVGPETLSRIANWRFLNEAHLHILKPKLENLCKTYCSHPVYQTFPVSESGLRTLAVATRSVKPARLRQQLSVCSIRAAKALKLIEDKGFDESLNAVSMKVRRLIDSDLGFVRVKRVEEIENRSDDFVYCFQIDDDSLPGFFAGEGAVFTHNCFGYLSYRNAKFGLIDCHIAVCAFARKILLDTVRIAERRGFEVIHGIVDSLWLRKQGAKKEDYLELCKEIQQEIGLPLSFEGLYKWIAFLPSRMHEGVPVLNRYFGMFEDGTLKLRGIESRRRDTIKLVVNCQQEIFQLLTDTKNTVELRNAIPEVLKKIRSYVTEIKMGRVPLEDLAIVNRLSKNYNEYTGNTAQAAAARQLAEEGMELMAGQSVTYVVTKFSSRIPTEKVRPVELLDPSVTYDKKRYVELLLRGMSTILEPIGLDEETLTKLIKYEPYPQLVLEETIAAAQQG
jgi:DNA polymerase elongation subunit (family B)